MVARVILSPFLILKWLGEKILNLFLYMFSTIVVLSLLGLFFIPNEKLPEGKIREVPKQAKIHLKEGIRVGVKEIKEIINPQPTLKEYVYNSFIYLCRKAIDLIFNPIVLGILLVALFLNRGVIVCKPGRLLPFSN